MLTTIKPHLVILTLPILLLDLLRRKEWRVLAGFAGGLIFCVLILFAFYPPWIQSFAGVVTSGMGNVRETPNITGLLVILGQYTLGKRVWPVALLGGLLWWLKSGKAWNRRTFIDISLAAGLIAAPVGWSYDQIMLLFPILSFLAWVVKCAVPQRISTMIVALLVLANLLAYLQHISRPSDVWFFWIPFFILGLYLFALNQMKKQSTDHFMAVQATDN